MQRVQSNYVPRSKPGIRSTSQAQRHVVSVAQLGIKLTLGLGCLASEAGLVGSTKVRQGAMLRLSFQRTDHFHSTN
jgi:hypothetical protein